MALNAWGNPFAVGGRQRGEGRSVAPRRSGRRPRRSARRGNATRARIPGSERSTVSRLRLDSNARRLQAYSDTLARVYREIPNETEVAITTRLSLVETASKTDTTFARQKQAAAILNPLYMRFRSIRGSRTTFTPTIPRGSLRSGSTRRAAMPGSHRSAPHAQHIAVAHFHPPRPLGRNDRRQPARFEAGLEYARPITSPSRRSGCTRSITWSTRISRRARPRARTTIGHRAEACTTGTSDMLVANYNRVAMEARLPLERGEWPRRRGLPVRAPS